MTNPLKISDVEVTEKEFNELKETNIGKFILYYMEAKAETIVQDVPNSIKHNRLNKYTPQETRQIYNEFKVIMDSLRDATNMRKEMAIIRTELNL